MVIFGFGTAFVNSFEQYVLFRFGTFQALTGYGINSIALSESRCAGVWAVGTVGSACGWGVPPHGTSCAGSGGKSLHFGPPGGVQNMCSEHPCTLTPHSTCLARHAFLSCPLTPCTWLIFNEPCRRAKPTPGPLFVLPALFSRHFSIIPLAEEDTRASRSAPPCSGSCSGEAEALRFHPRPVSLESPPHPGTQSAPWLPSPAVLPGPWWDSCQSLARGTGPSAEVDLSGQSAEALRAKTRTVIPSLSDTPWQPHCGVPTPRPSQ